ncbi:hypothetical protein [Mycolicibacterium sp.]|uniref:hypothetical protein n=1 Tax=Mycolicibacterium sp. TaxID=2320850 RepID=UPI001A3526DC|nr:hypothetical protein [Mycolicibacterium sp.]MBJ7340694.1 hypothetical protein [Mycolicibacterium sp.]
MEVSIRPWFTTGVALVGASAIAFAPINPTVQSLPAPDVAKVSAAVSRDFQLTALDIPYILTLPIVRQYVLNDLQNWAVYLAGFAKAGVGLAQSLLAIPGVTVETIQQVVALNFVGAFDTVATAVRDSVIAVGGPLLDSIVWRNQKYLLVQAALSAATPQAIIDVANGFLTAANGVTTSLIVGTQDFLAALLTLDLSNIVNAAITATQNFVVALGAGAGAIVGGIEAAQLGISTALATTPPPFPGAAATVADVSAFSTFSAENTVNLSRTANSVTTAPEAPAAKEQVAPLVDTAPAPVEADPVVAVANADPLPQDQKIVPPEVVKDVPVVPEAVKDETPESATPPSVDPPVKPSPTLPKDPSLTLPKDTVKDVAGPTGSDPGAGPAKSAGPDKGAGAGAAKDAGNDAKPSSKGDGE